MAGWLKLHRSLVNHWVWDDKYSKGQAWIDLLLHANFKDTKVMIKGALIDVKRGQQCRSQVTLAKQWGWSRDKVKRFLNALESDGMITQQTSQLTSIISICNYSKYQDEVSQDKAADQSPKKQQTGSRQGTEEEGKECKEDISLSSGDDQKPKETKKTRSPNIPYDQVFDLYNKILAQGIGLPSVQARDDERKRAIKKAWNYNKQANIDKHATNTIDYWDRYFTHCSTLVWMQPDTPRGQGHEKWQPDFDYCINTKTLKKVIEGKIT